MIGEIAAGALNAYSSYMQNKENIDLQREQNKIDRQRQDNAYTRAVADLRNAGLSPLVAAQNGGSDSTPLTAPQNTQNPMGSAIQGFSQALQARSMNAMNNAQIAKVLEETRGQSLNNAFIVQDMNARLLKLYEEANNIQTTTAREKVFLEQYKDRLQAELLGTNLKNQGQTLSNNAQKQDIAFKAENADFFRSMGLPPLVNFSSTSGGHLVDAARLETKNVIDTNRRDEANAQAAEAAYRERYNQYKESALKNYQIYLKDWQNTNKRMQKAFNGRSSPQWMQWYKNNPKPKKSDFLIDYDTWKKKNVR